MVSLLANGDLLVAFNETLPRRPWQHSPRDPRFVIHSRDEATSLIHQHDSLDGGRTWGPPQQTEIWGYLAHLLRLADGRLLTVYGIRWEPFGIRACLSTDAGETCDYAHEIIIRDDMPSSNLGYPTAVQLPEGRIFVAYYGDDVPGGDTYIIGSSFSLP